MSIEKKCNAKSSSLLFLSVWCCYDTFTTQHWLL